MLRENDDGAREIAAHHFTMPPFQSLKVWQHAQRLAVECHRAARRFPQEDRGIIADQLVRAASSVPLNIAEGSARKGSKEFRRFLDVARGSLAEVQSAFESLVVRLCEIPALFRQFDSTLDFGERAARDIEKASLLKPPRLYGACSAKSPIPPVTL